MRIRIVQGIDNDEVAIVAYTAELLRNEISSLSSHMLTEENPDIIHVIGQWDKKSMAIARESQQRHIAIIYTPLTALVPWNKPSQTKIKFSTKATFIITSGLMEYTLCKNFKNCHPHYVLNEITTSTTTRKEMVEAYEALYREAYDLNEQQLQSRIKEKVTMLKEDDTTITYICGQLLYAQCMYQRRNIPMKYIKDLSVFMSSNDYDEERMANLLELLNLTLFTQQLECVMKEHVGLTEGFMPIMWKEDKVSKDIEKCVTDY